uniref:PH domain-containing protein n=1 Tax=Eptatretus burgeri TaxID=7764 RepID=A0A8C4NKQ1_EPTBU
MDEATPQLKFAGFLEKHRDRLRLYWRRYWFVLRNDALLYYLMRDSSTPRGKINIHEVQGVRELNSVSRENVFEIVLEHGKILQLAAPSAEIRSLWIQLLWKCMQLPRPDRKYSAISWHDIPQLMERAARLSHIVDDTQSVVLGVSNQRHMLRSKSLQGFSNVLSFIRPNYRCSSRTASDSSSDEDFQTNRDSLDSGLSDSSTKFLVDEGEAQHAAPASTPVVPPASTPAVPQYTAQTSTSNVLATSVPNVQPAFSRQPQLKDDRPDSLLEGPANEPLYDVPRRSNDITDDHPASLLKGPVDEPLYDVPRQYNDKADSGLGSSSNTNVCPENTS